MCIYNEIEAFFPIVFLGQFILWLVDGIKLSNTAVNHPVTQGNFIID